MNEATPGPGAPSVAPLFAFLEQLAPHNVLARFQATMAQQQAAPAPAPARPWVQTTGHQATNIGLYTQQQYVGERARAGQNAPGEGGYLTGIGDIAKGSCPVPAASLARQPERSPTTIGIGNTAATTRKGIEVQEKYPAKEAERKYVLFAPIF